LHALNLPTLRNQPVVKASYTSEELDILQSELEALSAGAVQSTVEVRMARCACH